MDYSFVIKGNICQTINPQELDLHENAYAVCVGGISKGVFDTLPEEYASLPLYDYGDSLIFPGMVDLHVHAPQYAFRGMCMDLELMDWLNRYTFPEEEKYENLEYAEKAYSMFVDALKTGATTRACIFATRHRYATELLMKLMEESGLVSYVGKVNMDREASEALTEDSAEISAYTTFGWINAVKDKFKNTKPILTPRFIPCCTDKLMEELREIQMAYGIPVQSHLSESKGGGAFFGKVGSFEEGYEFDAVVLDDSVLVHPQQLNLAERMERAVYLGLDEKNITAKFVAGEKIFV